jgi:hypothetical protein
VSYERTGRRVVMAVRKSSAICRLIFMIEGASLTSSETEDECERGEGEREGGAHRDGQRRADVMRAGHLGSRREAGRGGRGRRS